MINIKETFLKLTTKRYPYETESEVMVIISELFPDLKFTKDEFNNYYLIIKNPDDTFSNTMFTSHLDTIDKGAYSYGKYVDGKYVYEPEDKTKKVVHVMDDDFVKTDGNSNLGADDKAGVTIMLNLMCEGIPGLYYFFVGEESGCKGSSSLSRKYKELVEAKTLPNVNKCVAFDRRGYDSIITHQMSKNCASTDFANDLAAKLNEYGFWFKPDDGGVYTDSAEFMDIIDECTNLSVGYFSEHMTTEKQDLEFLELLAITLTKIDWNSIVVVRNAENVVYTGKKNKVTTNYVRHYTGYSEDYGDDYWNNRYSNINSNTNFNGTTGSAASRTPSAPITNDVENDTEFDKWYNEQKNKGMHKTSDVLVN